MYDFNLSVNVKLIMWYWLTIIYKIFNNDSEQKVNFQTQNKRWENKFVAITLSLIFRFYNACKCQYFVHCFTSMRLSTFREDLVITEHFSG